MQGQGSVKTDNSVRQEILGCGNLLVTAGSDEDAHSLPHAFRVQGHQLAVNRYTQWDAGDIESASLPGKLQDIFSILVAGGGVDRPPPPARGYRGEGHPRLTHVDPVVVGVVAASWCVSLRDDRLLCGLGSTGS